MKIRTALRLLSTVSAVVVVVLMVSTGISAIQLRKAGAFELFLNALQREQEERVLLRDDFLLREQFNAYRLWQVKSEAFEGHLKELEGMSLSADGRALVERINRTFTSTKIILPRIFDLRQQRERGDPSGGTLLPLEKRLSNQQILNAYLLSNSLDLLLQNARNDTVLARNTLMLVFGLSTLLLALTVALTAVYTSRVMLNRVSALKTGTDRISEGKLDYQIPVEGQDELTDLAHQFNSMTDQVRRSYQALESANHELEGFTYSVSHDLRTPLRHVIAYSNLLKERNMDGFDETSRHYLRVISNGAERLGHLVDDLLTFSRMGRTEIVKKTVRLNEVVAIVLMELETAAVGRSVEWKVAQLPIVTGDESMLLLVMENLLANALKFTGRVPQAIIEVGSRIEGSEVVIFVRDNGAGFDMEYADKLFGLFRRLHKADEFEGTGVGLANVQRIIKRHGGRVWAEGKVDHGATFYFSLPI